MIEGKVAGVLNERELVINIGSLQGVKRGMKFKVLASEPLVIYDPETGEKLGMLDREKVRVAAVEVHKRFSICRTYRTRKVGGNSLYAATLLKQLAPPREEPETLKAYDSAYPPPLSEAESYVKRGDRVVQIEEDED